MKFLIYSFVLFSSLFSFAGTPEEDFVVDLTRESFRDGVRPTEADLYLNFQWVCGVYNTSPGNLSGTTGITLGLVHFIREGNKLVNRSFYFPGKVPLKAIGNELSSVIINQNGTETAQYSIRKNHDGLLVEVAVAANSTTTPSIINPELQAVSYAYCLPFDSNTNAPKVMNVPWSDVYTND